MNNEEIKVIVYKMCNVLEKIGQGMGLEVGTGQAARYEIASFMMYLSASDGKILWEEAKIISEMCDLNLTPESMESFINDQKIYTPEFETKVPPMYELMVSVDNTLFEAGETISGSGIMLDTYQTVGAALIKSDDDVDENELTDYNKYLTMMVDYRNANYKGAKAQ